MELHTHIEPARKSPYRRARLTVRITTHTGEKADLLPLDHLLLPARFVGFPIFLKDVLGAPKTIVVTTTAFALALDRIIRESGTRLQAPPPHAQRQ